MEKENPIVDTIIKDLCDRRGLRQAWDSIDADTQKEIREKWAGIIKGGVSLDFKWVSEPEFHIGQEVFYIDFDDNCPAANMRGRVAKGKVLGYRADITDTGSIRLTGFILNYSNLRSGDGSYQEIFATKEEADKYARWFPVEGITDEQWMKLTGERQSSRPKRIEDRPWIHQIKAEPIPIEESEIGVCCASISQARDYLMKCARNGGLIYRDVLMVVGGFMGCGDFLDRLHEFPILQMVCNQLPLKEAMEALKE